MDFPGFARHQMALKYNSMRGVYERPGGFGSSLFTVTVHSL